MAKLPNEILLAIARALCPPAFSPEPDVPLTADSHFTPATHPWETARRGGTVKKPCWTQGACASSPVVRNKVAPPVLYLEFVSNYGQD